ncbi:MAG: DUF362 domain-containing protein [Planctomycetes bacterium]|nr:DUF362 domain-containing protein [Planctomycetota bacterium]
MTATRREFLRAGIAAAAAGASPPSPAKARVVEARDAKLWEERGAAIDATRAADLVRRAIAALTGRSDPRDAWRSIFEPSDRIGIKVNGLAGARLSTRPELVGAVTDGLVAAGIPATNIIVFDRTNRELRAAGFEIRTGGAGVRCFGTDALAGGGYEDVPEISGEVGSCLSRILTREVTALISFGVIKDHDLSGVSIALKNLYGVIDNPNKYHDGQCDPYVADVAAFPAVRSKLRLAIADGSTAQCHAGPAFRSRYTWPYDGILIARDAVALDAIGAARIEARRKETGLPSLTEAKRPPRWLATAGRRGLGIADPARIEVVEA